MSNFTTAQLDNFWAGWVGLDADAAGYRLRTEPESAAMLRFIIQNSLYGYADYTRDRASRYADYAGYAGLPTFFNGPTKS
jgi:hypothetical protein